MKRNYPTKGRLRYLFETLAVSICVSTLWAFVEEIPGGALLGTIIAAAYYTFWIAKQRLMDITSDQEALQSSFRINIISTPKSNWGTLFWLYFICISGNAFYLSMSIEEANYEAILSGASFSSLLAIIFIPVHLYLLFKPGYKVEEPLVWYGPDYRHPQIEKISNTEPPLFNNPPISSIEDKLLIIKNLHSKGLISEDEMLEKRAEILKQLSNDESTDDAYNWASPSFVKQQLGTALENTIKKNIFLALNNCLFMNKTLRQEASLPQNNWNIIALFYRESGQEVVSLIKLRDESDGYYKYYEFSGPNNFDSKPFFLPTNPILIHLDGLDNRALKILNLLAHHYGSGELSRVDANQDELFSYMSLVADSIYLEMRRAQNAC